MKGTFINTSCGINKWSINVTSYITATYKMRWGWLEACKWMMLEIFIYQGHKQAIDVLAVAAVLKIDHDTVWCTLVDRWTRRVSSGWHSPGNKWNDLKETKDNYGKVGDALEMDLSPFSLHLSSPFTLYSTQMRSHLKHIIEAGICPVWERCQQTDED